MSVYTVNSGNTAISARKMLYTLHYNEGRHSRITVRETQPELSDFAALKKGLRQSAAINMFEFATYRQAARDAAGFYSARVQNLTDIVSGGLALDSKIGSQDNFFHYAVRGTLDQPVEMNFFGADAIKRAKPTHQYEIQTVVALGLLHHQQVGWRFHHTQQGSVAPRRAAQGADFFFSKAVAQTTMKDGIQRMRQRTGQFQGALLVALQQMVGHALGRFWADTGQAAQSFNQIFKAGRCFHFQNGSFIPGGKPKPDVKPLIFS